MKDLEKNPWKVLDSKLLYENQWIRLDENKVINPAGNNGIYMKLLVYRSIIQKWP